MLGVISCLLFSNTSRFYDVARSHLKKTLIKAQQSRNQFSSRENGSGRLPRNISSLRYVVSEMRDH